MYFHTLVPLAREKKKKERISFPPVDSFENVFIMILTFRYIIQKRTSTEKKREESRRKGKLNLIQAYPRALHASN